MMGTGPSRLQTAMVEQYAAAEDPFQAFWGGPRMLALHLGAERVFGLRPSLQFRHHPSLPAARSILAEHGGDIEVFIEAVYENTQRWLRKNGLQTVMLWRGLSVRGEQAANVRGLRRYAPDLAPLSSWTNAYEQAKVFAPAHFREDLQSGGRLLLAEFPAERVCSLYHTGFGDILQAEAIVMGGAGETWALSWHGRADPLACTSEAEYLRLVRQAVAHESVP